VGQGRETCGKEGGAEEREERKARADARVSEGLEQFVAFLIGGGVGLTGDRNFLFGALGRGDFRGRGDGDGGGAVGGGGTVGGADFEAGVAVPSERRGGVVPWAVWGGGGDLRDWK
jgi:hypothetical protein